MRYTSWTPEELEENERMVLEENDAIVIYKLHHQFGFTEEQAQGLVACNKYLRVISNSLLVQTFMRKLRDGMDRRRP